MSKANYMEGRLADQECRTCPVQIEGGLLQCETFGEAFKEEREQFGDVSKRGFWTKLVSRETDLSKVKRWAAFEKEEERADLLNSIPPKEKGENDFSKRCYRRRLL
jgi:hypothetical protein